jgi:PAS domain S-box-containing protein
MSLKLKLNILFLAVALIPLLFVSALTFHNYKKSLETTCLSNLRNIAAFKADKIEAYFDGLKDNIAMAQGFYNIKKNLPTLNRFSGDPNHPEFILARKMLDDQLQHIQSILQLYDIMLVNPEGRVVYSSNPGHFPAEFSNPLADPEQKAFEKGKESIYLSDIFLNQNDTNRPTLLATAPAVDLEDIFAGVIVFEIDTSSVNRILLDVTGLGKTGEVLVGRKNENQVFFLSPLKFDPLAVLKKKLDIGQDVGNPIQEAVQGKTGSGISIDYRGKEVIAAWRYISSLNWGMVAKIDTDEAFTEAVKLRNLAILILAMVIALSSVTAFSISRSISEPIRKLSHGAEIIGEGNLDYKIRIPLNDEIGQLSRAFDKMTCNLKQTLASREELNREIIERKQAEKALIVAHRRLVLAQQSAGAGIWEWDIRTDKLNWSPELFRLFGLDPKEQPSFNLWQGIIHPHDYEQAQKRIEQAIKNQTALDNEYRILLSSGQVRWINALGSTVYDENGQPLSMSGICIDITERKQAEEALRKERDFSSAVLDTAGALVAVLDKEGRITRFNRACEEATGYTSSEALGRVVWEFLIPPAETQGVKQVWKTLCAGKFPFKYENHWLGKTGSLRLIDWSNTAITSPDGQIEYIIGTGVDITEYRMAEAALRESREDLNRAQAVGNIGSWRLDIQHNKLAWSDENYRIFGIPKGTPLTYETFLSAIHPDDREFVDKKWHAALQGEHYDIEHRIIVADKTRWVREKAYLEFDKQGALLGGFGITQDISDRKKKEEELYRLNRTLKALSNSNQAIMQVKDESEYLREVCNIIVRDCGHTMVWIGFVREDEGCTVQPVASAGFEKGYLETLNITWADTERGRGPTGTAIRTGKPGMCKNMQTDPAFEPWRQEAIRRGYASSIAFPLKDNVRVFGAITIYSKEPAPFSEDEVKLLTELAADLAYGITAIRLRTEHAKIEEAVKVSEVRYRRLFEASRDGILILNAETGQIVDVNPFIEEMLGYSHKEFLYKKLWEIGLFKNIAASKDAFLDLQNKGYVRHENLPLQTKNGSHISVEFVSNVYIVDHQKVIQCNIRNITDRVQAQEELRKSRDELEMRVKNRTKELAQTVEVLEGEIRERIVAENTVKTERKRFYDVLETLPSYVCLLTKDYYMPFANRVFRETFGYRSDRKCYEFLFNRTKPCEICKTYMVLKSNDPQHWEWTGPNGRTYDVFDYPFKDTDGTPLILEMGIDITDQKDAEKKVLVYQKRMRSLATEIVLTEERERRTIAAALHDSLGPLLAFSKRELGIIRKSAPAELTESLAYVHDKIKQAVDQTRNLTFDLSPATLYTLGLEHALEEMVEHFAQEGRFNGNCHICEPIEPLAEDIRILLYRSVRELMVNIVKHAGAKNVNVTLSMNGNDIQVAVEDDGVGFDISDADLKTGKLKGFGLFNIQERLIQAGGRIDLQSPNGGGIKIVLQLPLTSKKE